MPVHTDSGMHFQMNTHMAYYQEAVYKYRMSDLYLGDIAPGLFPSLLLICASDKIWEQAGGAIGVLFL